MKTGSFKEFVLDQLSSLGDVTAKAMFGGQGIYRGTTFFAILHKDRLYFKTGETNRADYERRGMKPFRPHGRPTLKYHEVPADVIESRAELTAWARESLRIAYAG